MENVNKIFELAQKEIATINKIPKNKETLSSSDFMFILHKKEILKQIVKLIEDNKLIRL